MRRRVLLEDDPLEGPLLLVGGDAPLVARVDRARGTLGGYHLEQVPGEWTNPAGTFWPEVVPADMRGWRCVVVVPLAGLRPVELLRVLSGGAGSGLGLRRDEFYYWQEVPQTLEVVTEREARQVLASPWFGRQRGDGATAAVRAIATGRLGD